MAVRRWGVVKAPGTQITELDSPPRITDKDLGVSVFVGLTRKGEMGEPIKVTSFADFIQKCGDPVSWSYLPECIKGFFTEAGGTGKAYVVRVPDTTAVKATAEFYTYIGGDYVVLFTAKSEGAWAGSYDGLSCSVTAKSGNQVTISGATTPKDHKYTGGYLENEGKELLKGTSYRVLSQVGNTLILDADFSDSVPSTDWTLTKRNTDGILSIRTYPNSQDSGYFDVYFYFNGKKVREYQMLTLDPNSPRFIETVINNDDTNHYATVSVTGGNGTYHQVCPVHHNAKLTVVSATGNTVVVDLGAVPFTDDEVIGYNLLRIIDTTPLKWDKSYRITGYGLNEDGNLYFTVESTVSGLSAGVHILLDGNIGMAGGYDGELCRNYTTDGYEAIIPMLEVSTTPLGSLGEGFVKVCVPGYSALDNADAITSAGLNLAEAFNYQFRVEANIDDDPLDIANSNRSDLAVMNYPCWGKVVDSFGGITVIPIIGDILGEECRIANAYSGYYKAEAGTEAVLSRILTCVDSSGDVTLTDEKIEEYNPAGINCITVKDGNLVIWGDRTLASTTTWRWKHQREQMSYYEHILLNSTNWLMFRVNNPELWVLFKSYLKDYFYREYKKGAIYSITGKFDDACNVIVDWTNNNDVTIDEGILLGEVWLKFSGTVEQVRIGIGKTYVYEYE